MARATETRGLLHAQPAQQRLFPAPAHQVEWTEDAGRDSDGRERVRILRGVAPGQWTRPAGSDIAAGTQVLPPNTRLSASDVGLLAMVRARPRSAANPRPCDPVLALSARKQLGRSGVTVRRLPRVGVLSTGDEVADAGTAAGGARIFDSNRPMLLQAVRQAGGAAVDLGACGTHAAA